MFKRTRDIGTKGSYPQAIVKSINRLDKVIMPFRLGINTSPEKLSTSFVKLRGSLEFSSAMSAKKTAKTVDMPSGAMVYSIRTPLIENVSKR
jgi:hypothetical protein